MLGSSSNKGSNSMNRRKPTDEDDDDTAEIDDVNQLLLAALLTKGTNYRKKTVDDSKPYYQSGNLISINTNNESGQKRVAKEDKELTNKGDSTPVLDELEEEKEKFKFVIPAEDLNEDLLEFEPLNDLTNEESSPVELGLDKVEHSSNGVENIDELILDVSESLSSAIEAKHSERSKKSPEIEKQKSQEPSAPNELQSSVSLDCDDILNFDFEDLNDLDSFLDKHASVDKENPKETPASCSESPTISTSKNRTTELNQVTSTKGNKVDTNSKQEQKIDGGRKIILKGSKLDQKSDAVPVKKEKIVFSAPGSPVRTETAKLKTQVKENVVDDKAKRIEKSDKDADKKPKVFSKRDEEMMHSLDKELDAFKAGLAKIEVPVNIGAEKKRSRRRPVEYNDLDLGAGGGGGLDVFSGNDKFVAKRSKHERKKSTSRERKQKRRKRRRVSTPSSDSVEESSYSDSQEYLSGKDSDSEPFISTASSDDSISDDAKRKKKSKDSRKRPKDAKRSLNKERKKKRRHRKKERDEGKKKKRQKSKDEVAGDVKYEPINAHLGKLSQNYEEFSDDAEGDPYAHLKVSSDLDSVGSSAKRTPNFKDAVDIDDDAIEFEEDDDIFKVASIESDNLDSVETSGKQLSLLDQLKLKHRSKVTYSDEDYANEEEDVESLLKTTNVRAPNVTIPKRAVNNPKLLQSNLNRKVILQKQATAVKRPEKVIKRRPVTTTNSDSEGFSSKPTSSLNVKDRLTLTKSLLQKSFAAPKKSPVKPTSEAAQIQHRSVHSRLGVQSRGSSSSGTNHNNALSRYL